MKKYLPMLLLLCAVAAFAAGCSDNGGRKTGSDGVDLDLSELNDLLAYSQVVKILENPDDYLGKTIKVSGQYYASYYAQTDSYYHFVVIGDESACCLEGLEFKRSGDYAYPEDYPADGVRIDVIGVFERYTMLGNTYYRLSVTDA